MGKSFEVEKLKYWVKQEKARPHCPYCGARVLIDQDVAPGWNHDLQTHKSMAVTCHRCIGQFGLKSRIEYFTAIK